MKTIPKPLLFQPFVLCACVLVCLLTAACTGQSTLPTVVPPTTVPPSTSVSVTVETTSTSIPPTPIPSPIPSQAAPDSGELPRPYYRIDASLDYELHQVSVQEFITYTNRSNDTLIDLLLVVEPLNYKNVFTLITITWKEGQLVGNISWEGHLARIPLPVPLTPGESITLKLEYGLTLPDPATFPSGTRPVPFGYSQRQINLVDWYPYLAIYKSDQGWLAHPPSYYGEHQVYEAADFDVKLVLKSALPELVVAASTLTKAQPQNNIYEYRLLNARSFAISVSDQYQVFTQEIDGVTVLSYAFPYHIEAGKQALKITAEALELFSQLYGPYPHPALSVVEADFLDGMEYDGLYFLSNGFYNLYAGSPAEYLTAIAAHETAHQWWYGLVGNDQAIEPWLDEALCTYSERIFYENLYPQALEWWWTYRINYYQPEGWVDTTIYNPEGSLSPYQYYRNAVYLNGALFMEDLRSLIGDQSFFSFLAAYTKQFQGQITTQELFFQFLSQHTQQDFSVLLSKYFKYVR